MDALLPGTQSAESTERTIVKPKTLNEILRSLCLIDEAMLEVDLSEAPDLIDQGKVKIDNYKYLIDEMDLRRESMKRKKDEYAKAEKTLDNQIKRLKEHLIYAMQANGFEKFTGNEYKCWVQYSESVKLSLTEPNAQMKIHFPDLIKTSYEWKLTPIKQILKKDPASLDDESDRNLAEKVREFATITKTPSVRFSVLKDF